MFYAEQYYSLTNTDLVRKIGNYIKNVRLELNLTQKDLAYKSGLDRTSLSGIENGRGTNLSTLIEILRVLGKLEVIGDLFEDNVPVSPILMVKLQGKKRKYASSKRKIDNPKKDSEW